MTFAGVWRFSGVYMCWPMAIEALGMQLSWPQRRSVRLWAKAGMLFASQVQVRRDPFV